MWWPEETHLMVKFGHFVLDFCTFISIVSNILTFKIQFSPKSEKGELPIKIFQNYIGFNQLW